jgi:hypothetical protein
MLQHSYPHRNTGQNLTVLGVVGLQYLMTVYQLQKLFCITLNDTEKQVTAECTTDTLPMTYMFSDIALLQETVVK